MTLSYFEKSVTFNSDLRFPIMTVSNIRCMHNQITFFKYFRWPHQQAFISAENLVDQEWHSCILNIRLLQQDSKVVKKVFQFCVTSTTIIKYFFCNNCVIIIMLYLSSNMSSIASAGESSRAEIINSLNIYKCETCLKFRKLL